MASSKLEYTDPWPIPEFRIEITAPEHEGAALLRSMDLRQIMYNAALASFQWLYTPSNVPRNVQQIHLICRRMDGVAYTTGSHTHKEIHLSLEHVSRSGHRAEHEVRGVLVHEVVHCYQYNGRGTAPGGLIEGIADWVRLHMSLGPPHWKREPGSKWDAGYQSTAYFLDWIGEHYGHHAIPHLNGLLCYNVYDDNIWSEVCGDQLTIDDLWGTYKGEFGGDFVEELGGGRLIWDSRVKYLDISPKPPSIPYTTRPSR